MENLFIAHVDWDGSQLVIDFMPHVGVQKLFTIVV